MIPDCLKRLSALFNARGVSLYLVGGFVRNIVLGIPGSDFDICSRALPEQAAAIARDAGLTVIEKAPALGTIEIRMQMDAGPVAFEHTTWRRDFYPAGGVHRPRRVVFTTDIAQDAARRDFTVNALYMDIQSGNLLDPTGRGMVCVREKRLEAAAQTADVTIRDDGLRIMRMARFAAELGFDVSAELLDSATRHAGLLADISAERKYAELKKILLADTKYPQLNATGPLLGLSLLRQTGALAFVLPRLWEGRGVTQSKIYHAYDVLDHCLHTCAATPPVLVLRLAGLLHDIGKPEALRRYGRMYGHELIGEKLAEEEFDALKVDHATRRAVLPLIRNHMFDLQGEAKPKTIRRRAIKLGREGFERLIALRRADVIGSGRAADDIVSASNWQAELDRMVTQRVPWCIRDLDVTGDELSRELSLPPSPAIGRLLDALHAECVMKPAMNKKELLLRRARRLKDINVI